VRSTRSTPSTTCSTSLVTRIRGAFFFRIGQRPLAPYYEEIAGDLEGSIALVLDTLTLESPAQSVPVHHRTSRRSDEPSKCWV
jgi:hypothetical protein